MNDRMAVQDQEKTSKSGKRRSRWSGKLQEGAAPLCRDRRDLSQVTKSARGLREEVTSSAAAIHDDAATQEPVQHEALSSRSRQGRPGVEETHWAPCWCRDFYTLTSHAHQAEPTL